MCFVCSEWNKGKLTAKEALRNLGELIDATDEDSSDMRHYFQTVDRIIEEEIPTIEEDDQLVTLDSLDSFED